MATDATHAMRTHELDLAIPLIPAGAKLLELGAGDGWQAAQLSKCGFSVAAIDIVGSAKHSPRYFPVMEYDGTALPLQDNSFDAVYSSNVLEHISNFPTTQAELARVLKPGGIAVHCVPSAVWRIWTTLGHPIYAARWGVNLVRNGFLSRNRSPGSRSPEQLENLGLLSLLRLALVPTRHGEHGSWLSEHFLFTKSHWKSRFEETGWEVISVHPTGLFYSGNEVLGLKVPIHSRMRIANILGSSSLIFILRATTCLGRL